MCLIGLLCYTCITDFPHIERVKNELSKDWEHIVLLVAICLSVAELQIFFKIGAPG